MEGSLHRTTKEKVGGRLHRRAKVPNQDGNILRTKDQKLNLKQNTTVLVPALIGHRATTDLLLGNAIAVVRDALRRKEASVETIPRASTKAKEVPAAAKEVLNRGNAVGSPYSARRRRWFLFPTWRR